MDERALNYIYHDIAITNAAVKMVKLEKLEKHVRKLNNKIAAVALVTAIYLAVTNTQLIEQYKEIRSLKKDIEELKKAKGE